MRFGDAYFGEMDDRGLSEMDVERLLAGEAPVDGEDHEELAGFLADLKVTYAEPPPERVEVLHLAQMSQVTRRNGQGTQPIVLPRAVARDSAPRRQPMTPKRLALVLGALLLAAPLSTLGLAFAGVTLPDAVRAPFEAVGIELPNQPDGDEVEAVIEGTPAGQQREKASQLGQKGLKQREKGSRERQGASTEKQKGSTEEARNAAAGAGGGSEAAGSGADPGAGKTTAGDAPKIAVQGDRASGKSTAGGGQKPSKEPSQQGKEPSQQGQQVGQEPTQTGQQDQGAEPLGQPPGRPPATPPSEPPGQPPGRPPASPPGGGQGAGPQHGQETAPSHAPGG